MRFYNSKIGKPKQKKDKYSFSSSNTYQKGSRRIFNKGMKIFNKSGYSRGLKDTRQTSLKNSMD